MLYKMLFEHAISYVRDENGPTEPLKHRPRKYV